MTDKKLLKIIEGLTLVYENGKKSSENGTTMLLQIYRTAHLVGDCKHKDWEKEAEKTYKELRKHGII